MSTLRDDFADETPTASVHAQHHNDLADAVNAAQPIDANLTAIAALTPADDAILQRKGGAWTASGPASVKTDLALTKDDVGLFAVDDTSDLDKPVSVAQADADALALARSANLADLDNPADARAYLGLGNVDDTRDADKPVSTAQADADAANLAKSANLADLDDPAAAQYNIGLGNAENTPDMGKPVSVAQQAAIVTASTADRARANHTGTQAAVTIADFAAAADARITAQKGAPSGLAPLNPGGTVPAGYLPPAGPSVAYRGAWNDTTAYVAGDIVSRRGSTYLANGASLGAAPVELWDPSSVDMHTFEAGVGPWTALNGGSLARDTAQFHSGVASLRVNPVASGSLAYAVGHPFTTTAGTVCTATVWARCSAARVMWLWCSEEGPHITVPANVWTRLALTWTHAGDAPYLQPFITGVVAGDSVWLDDWSIYAPDAAVMDSTRFDPLSQAGANASYPTASRPAPATVAAGTSVYDTTLNKPIWSTGSVWKDAAGTTV